MIYLLRKEDRRATIISNTDNRFMNYKKEFGSTIIENSDMVWTQAKLIIKELESLGYQHHSAPFKYDDKIAWYKHGTYHREDGAALEWNNGTRMWYYKGALHRVGGPAVTNPLGNEDWYFEGNLHREDGPAESVPREGYKGWLKHGVYHRLDGPAREWSNGIKQFWIDGQDYTEEDFWNKASVVRSDG